MTYTPVIKKSKINLNANGYWRKVRYLKSQYSQDLEALLSRNTDPALQKKMGMILTLIQSDRSRTPQNFPCHLTVLYAVEKQIITWLQESQL
mmetsp:Transcript_17887/g.22725  ORF Transcript_17887/g.22725 Transcript_17887/m.22725 type:complete len:92 (-) Transcript_17887:41-316(-)